MPSRIKDLLWELGNYAHALSRPASGAPRFVIFTQGRSGGTLLQSLLGSHPGIACEGELLAYERLSPTRYVEGRANRFARRGLAWSFRLKHWHLTKIQRSDPQAFLENLAVAGWHVVYLERTNVVAQAVSRLVGRARMKWHVRTGEAQLPAVAIDLQQLEWVLNASASQREIEQRCLRAVDHVHLVYERDLENAAGWQAACDRVFRSLDLESHAVQTRLRKTADSDWGEILNREEVEQKLRQLGFGGLDSAPTGRSG